VKIRRKNMFKFAEVVEALPITTLVCEKYRERRCFDV